MSARFNISELLADQARRAPTRAVLIEAGTGATLRRIDYAGLQRTVDRDARALLRAGLRRGDRVCVFVTPGIEWAALVFALFRIGAPPVLIDPAMGRSGLLQCIERIRPRGFVGIPRAAAVKLAFPRAFASVEVSIVCGALPIGGRTLSSLRRDDDGELVAEATGEDELAAVLFTSGSTGPAKGVGYTHAMFRAQVAALAELYTMRAGDVDLACFAPFALFGPALGLSTVLPDIDFSAPAKADPERIVSAVRAHGAVQTFGSPAIWKRVASWAREHDASMPTLRRLMIAGAPVHPALIEACLALLPPDGDVFTPYGATEALPIASASGREILALHRGATESGSGNCIGTLAPFVEARVMRVTDAAVPRWSDDLAVRPGESGELVVAGPQVTREYVLEPEHTARAKIDDGGRVWHRMGDVVRVDDAGRLWFRGRKSHRLETRAGPLDPVGVENVFNTHPNVGRSALVGVGARGEELPVLVVELAGGAKPSEALSQSILELHSRCPDARRVERVLYRSSLPVDVRHNAKIDRGALKLWAERELA